MIGVTGSNLTDLARNRILADESVGNELAAAEARAIQREQMRQQNNQFLQEQALRQNAMNQDYGYRNNLLAQQDRQWNTPNATSIAQIGGQKEIAAYPWTRGITPAEQANLELGKKSLDNQFALATMPYTMGGFPPWAANSRAGQSLIEAQLAEKSANDRRQRALAIANAKIKADPARFWATDRGQAADVISSLVGEFPEASELVFDPVKWEFALPQPPTQPPTAPGQPGAGANQFANPFQIAPPQTPPAPTNSQSTPYPNWRLDASTGRLVPFK